MAVAAGARSGLAALIAACAHSALTAQESKAFFQFLFLQGGVAALLSASAYTRAAHLASRDSRLVAGSLRSFGAFVLCAAGLLPLLGWLVTPDYSLSPAVRFLVVALMIFGAAASAISAFLQGLLVGGRVQATAFWPVIVTSSVAAVASLLWYGEATLVGLTFIWVGAQVGNPLLLTAASRTAQRYVLQAFGAPFARGNYFGLTGGVNSSSIGVAFLFRERWAASQEGADAAATFAVVRLTEIAYQMVSMVMSSVPRLTRGMEGRVLGSPILSLALGVVGCATSLLCVLPSVSWEQWSLERLLLAEVMAVPARLVALVTGMMLLSRDSTRGFVLGMLSTVAAGVAMAWIPPVQSSPFGLQAFQAGGTMPMVVCALLVSRSGRRQTRVPGDRSACRSAED